MKARDFAVTWIAATSFIWAAQSEEEPVDLAKEFSILEFGHSIELEEVSKPFHEEVTTLGENYLGALARTMEQEQDAGNLESVLSIRKEMETLQETQQPGTEAFPNSDRFRETYQSALEEIESRRATALRVKALTQIEELAAFQRKATKAGEIDLAISVSKWIEERQKELDEGVVSSSSTSLPRPTISIGSKAPPLVEDSVLYTTERLGGTLEITPGLYRFPSQIHLGLKEGKSREEKMATLEIPSGTVFEDITLFADEADVAGTGVRFKGGAIKVDLGGVIVFQDSVFENTKLEKGGAWSVKYYSAKWTLENCLVFGSFPAPLRPRANGVQVEKSTVINATVNEAHYYDKPVEESEHDWRRIDSCHFINCVIPESALLMMENCVFEDCEFVSDIDRIKPEKPKTVRIYLPTGSPSTPVGNNRVTFEIVAPSRLGQRQIGTTLPYRVSNNSLELN